MSEYEALIEPLLQELDLDVEGIHVAAVGGGTGMAQALKAIQHYTDVITAVVTAADDGGSSGRLLPAFGIPPPGDLRQALLALSSEDSVLRRLVAYRFADGDVAGHSLGNLILAALAEIDGDLQEALDSVGRMLGARGVVVPAADRPMRLEAVVGGEPVAGQAALTRARGELSAIRLLPEGIRATERAAAALAGADQIVLGPGSLFTSTIACLLVPGIAEAIEASHATLVYVCNLATQDGETLGMDGVAHVEALISFGGIRAPDVVVAHQGPVDPHPGTEPVNVDRAGVAALGCDLEMADLLDPAASGPIHDPARLGAVLRRLA
jgi:uncharacterized cofD-like protein